MKRLLSIVLLIVVAATLSFAFEVIDSYGRAFEGIFYEYIPGEGKPEDRTRAIRRKKYP